LKQYIDLGNRIIDEGEWIANERTGKRCLTVIGANLKYDMSERRLPMVTTRDMTVLNFLGTSLWQASIGEFLGYLKGYSNAADFRGLGCNTWDANANKNQAWLENPYRKGEDDMGRVYGVQMRRWKNFKGETFDQLREVYEALKTGKDNRSLIIQMFNPGEKHMGCLNACVHTHTFSLVNGVLHLTSDQRSDDIPLGHVFNQIQCGFFLLLMAQITGNLPGTVHHNIVNAHIYEDQLMTLQVQLLREPRDLPSMAISEDIRTLEDVENIMVPDHCSVLNYHPHPPIKHAFSV